MPLAASHYNPTYFTNGCGRNLINNSGEYFSCIGITYASTYGRRERSTYSTGNLTRNPNSFNQQTILLPINTFFEKDPYTSIWHPAGQYPDVRAVYMTNYRAGDTITLGTDIWKIFPLVNQFGTTSPSGSYTPHSGNYGLAFLTNPA